MDLQTKELGTISVKSKQVKRSNLLNLFV